LTQTGTAIGQPEDDVVKGIVGWSGQKANRKESGTPDHNRNLTL